MIDIKLPDVSGFELMRQIRKEDPGARIIMFSMNDDPAFAVRAVEMGAQGYLSKSDDPRLFVEAVHHALGISYKTVANTTSLLKQKLGANGRPHSYRGGNESQLRSDATNFGIASSGHAIRASSLGKVSLMRGWRLYAFFRL